MVTNNGKRKEIQEHHEKKKTELKRKGKKRIKLDIRVKYSFKKTYKMNK